MHLSFKKEHLEVTATTLVKYFSKNVIRIDGAMGAGKTTLIAQLCKKLGVQDEINSPSFSLVNTYLGTNGPIYHFDFYRLNHSDEALDIGVEEYFESGNLCLLEWAEKITPHLPLDYDHFKIEVLNDDTRVLSLINP